MQTYSRDQAVTGFLRGLDSPVRRAGRPGATALLLGIVGTVAGAGVASGHLAKAGTDAAAVLAVIVLAAGLFLLIWGAVALVRAVPGWWRLLAIPAVWVLLEFVLFPLTMAVYATNVPPGRLASRCSSSPVAASPTSRSRRTGSGPPHPPPCRSATTGYTLLAMATWQSSGSLPSPVAAAIRTPAQASARP